MDLTYTCFLYLLVVNVDTFSAQFMAVPRKVNKPNGCDGPSKTALVEHFFNVIFTEFQSNPPVCICVQMCVDQPTYCYPNGCLKKVDYKRKVPEHLEHRPAAPVANLQNNDAANTMFLVENDFAHLMNDNGEVNKDVNAERFSIKDIRPDPFKDRYKSLFKYKKMPKVELRYNLREQVKNMKSDILKVETKDVSKTRWPKNNNYLVLREQQMFNINDRPNEPKAADGSSNKFFIQNPGIDRDLYAPKFFKRDLRRNNKDDVDGQSDYLTETPDPLETRTFSLDTLIDNLIGNNYETNFSNDRENKQAHNTSQAIDEIITLPDNITGHNNTKDKKEITCVVSLNMTNENIDENKYEESPVIKKHLDKWKNYTFNEMIAALSKKIEKQNNTSMEIMKDGSRNKIELTITGPIKNLKDKDNLSVIEEIHSKEINNTGTETSSRHKENSTEFNQTHTHKK